MKIRYGFVSNSSSSSFVIAKDKISDEQLEILKKHTKYARDNLGWSDYEANDYDMWEITESDGKVKFFTIMDNFPMEHFLSLIGVDTDYIED